MKKNKGITMIALIITIIILLILAGVSIALLTGENGIIKKAELAKNRTEEAELEENATLIDYENMMDGYISENINNKTSATVENTMSNTEHFTGEYYFNGKPIYEKTIYIASLPNATIKTYNHDISDVDLIWYDTSKTFLIWETGSVSVMPRLHVNTLSAQILLDDLTNTYFKINTGSMDRHTAKAYITLKFTKTTDASNGNDTIPATSPTN